MTRRTLPLPTATQVRDMKQGYGRAGRIRFFYGERCSLQEISAYLEIAVHEVRRALLRPVIEPVAKPKLARYAGDCWVEP